EAGVVQSRRRHADAAGGAQQRRPLSVTDAKGTADAGAGKGHSRSSRGDRGRHGLGGGPSDQDRPTPSAGPGVDTAVAAVSALRLLWAWTTDTGSTLLPKKDSKVNHLAARLRRPRVRNGNQARASADPVHVYRAGVVHPTRPNDRRPRRALRLGGDRRGAPRTQGR